jgi:L-fuculose-phosphate aldolase
MMHNLKNSTEEVVDTCHRLYERGYLSATSGNVSVRTNDGFLITPTNRRKDQVEASEIVACHANGEPIKVSSKPSCEVPMHKKIYSIRPEIGAAIHAHPTYALACSLLDIDMEATKLPEFTHHLGKIALIPYAEPGTEDVAKALEPALPDHNAFLLWGHGALLLGKDLTEAYNRLEHLEHLARISYLINTEKR